MADRKSKNPITIWPRRLDISDGLPHTLESGKSRLYYQWRDELASKRKQAGKEQELPLPCPLHRCHQVWPRFRMGVLTLNDLTKKNFSPLYPAPWVFINSIYRQVDKQKEPSQLLYYGMCVCVCVCLLGIMLKKCFHLKFLPGFTFNLKFHM